MCIRIRAENNIRIKVSHIRHCCFYFSVRYPRVLIRFRIYGRTRNEFTKIVSVEFVSGDEINSFPKIPSSRRNLLELLNAVEYKRVNNQIEIQYSFFFFCFYFVNKNYHAAHVIKNIFKKENFFFKLWQYEIKQGSQH